MNGTDPQQAEEAKFFADSGKIWDALTLQNNQEVQELAFPGMCGNGFGDRIKNRITEKLAMKYLNKYSVA